MKSTVGEINEVEGGHFVRSTGRKDRHSKVHTSKGPRDRRVRLAAHTAIEFYDVQDRLGYDRPSKAMDWLIKKAKPSIDKLVEAQSAGSSVMAIGEQSESSSCYNFQLQKQLGDNPGNSSASVQFPPHFDTDHITFFPTIFKASSTNNSTQDFGLSLNSFQHHPGLIPWQSQQGGENHAASNEHQTFIAGSTDPVGFRNHYHQRILTWNWNNEATSDHVNKVGFKVNSEQFLGQGSCSAYSRSGTTLQPSFSTSVRAWNDIPMASSDHHHRSQTLHQASIFRSRFLPDEGVVRFGNISDKIQGEEENNGVAPNKPSSASPSSHH